MSMLDFGLGLAGMPQETIARIDAEMPALARLVRAAKQVDPILQPIEPNIEQIWIQILRCWPAIVKAWPIIQAEVPDIKSAMPVIVELAAFIDAKMKE